MQYVHGMGMETNSRHTTWKQLQNLRASRGTAERRHADKPATTAHAQQKIKNID